MPDPVATLPENSSAPTPNSPLARYMQSRAMHIAHASGGFAAPARAAYEAAKAPQKNSAGTDTARAPRRTDNRDQARPDTSRRQTQQPSKHPWQDGLESGLRNGAIPGELGGALLRMIDPRLNRAQQSEGASRAAIAIAVVEDRAFPATPYLSQLGAMMTQVEKMKVAYQTLNDRVHETIGNIYKAPAAAAATLRKLIQNRLGPGHIAREIEQEPGILGGLRGDNMLLFMGIGRKEYDAAISAVPTLAGAIEDRGRTKAQLDKDLIGLKDLQGRPAQSTSLTIALQAQKVLDAVHAATPGADPITSPILHSFAHMAALDASVADIESATDISQGYRTRLMEQALRRDGITNLQRDRNPRNAVQRYLAASHMAAQNESASKKLMTEGFMLEASEAEKWQAMARGEMAGSAKEILASFDLREEAAAKNILAHVLDTDTKARDLAADRHQGYASPMLAEDDYGADA